MPGGSPTVDTWVGVKQFSGWIQERNPALVVSQTFCRIEPRDPACEEFTSRQAGWVGVIKHLQEHTGLYPANRSLSKLIHQRLTQKFFLVVVG